jgi:hypothetical protein
MASENTPLVVKSDEEFPARRTIGIRVTIKGMGTDRYRLPAAWQNFTSAPVRKEVYGSLFSLEPLAALRT